MSVLYPAAMAVLRLRFTDEATGATPPTPVTAAELVARQNAPASRRSGALPPTIGGSAGGDATHVVPVVPRSVSARIPSAREAGTYTMDFLWVDLPIDPRFVKACAVEIHLGSIGAEHHANAMGWRGTAALRRAGRIKVLDRMGGPNPRTLALVGIVDEMSVTHARNGSTIHVEGRDLSALLLDEPFPGAALDAVDLSRDIGDVVRQILAFHPHGATIAPYVVVADASEWPSGRVPSPAPEPTRTRRGADGKRKGARHRGPMDPGDLNFWDVIIRYCQLVGATAYFAGQELRVVPTRSLYEAVGDRGDAPTPFYEGRPRTVGGESIRVPRLRYGRELEELKFSRKLAGVRAQPVEVVSVDDSSTARPSERYVYAKWPPDGEAAGGRVRTTETPGGEAGQRSLTVPVPGIKDRDQLLEIARAVYEEVMRGELVASFATREMASAGGGEYDLDLLRMRPGSAVELLVETAGVGSVPNVASTLTEMAAESRGKLVDRVGATLGDRSLAEAVVRSWRGEVARLQTIYHVESMGFSYDWSSGLRINGDAKGYIEVELGPKVTKPTSPQRSRSSRPKRPVVLQSTMPAEEPVVVDYSVGMSLVE